MKILNRIGKFSIYLGILLSASAVIISAMVLTETSRAAGSQSPAAAVQTECTFSDGSTITFGRKAFSLDEPGADAWRAGEYVATGFRASEAMQTGVEIPAGTYTLFLRDEGEPPWTLVISKETGEWGMPYPGERYDLGRIQMGSDVRPPEKNLTVGCVDHKDTHGPTFMWIQSGKRVAYAKIMAKNVTQGKTTLLN